MVQEQAQDINIATKLGRPKKLREAYSHTPQPLNESKDDYEGANADVVGQSFQFNPVQVADPLEAIAAKALADGKKQSAFLQAGFTMEQINAKPAAVKWIFNEKIGNLSPMVGGFVPRGEEGYFIYEPVYEVTDENKKEHIELCKQRINTKAISSKVIIPDFENDASGLMKPAQPLTPQEVRVSTGVI